MSSIFSLLTVWITVFLLVTNAVTVVNSIPNRELDSMLNTLRARGYHLFCNAILTSDLRVDLSSDGGNSNDTHSFTFFAPTDSSLFALDMTQTASLYTDTLRYHIIPRRLSLSELRVLRNGYTLPTLLSTRRLPVTRRSGSSVAIIGGVEVSFPGLFYGRHVAVHGLAGILSLRLNNTSSSSPAPVIPPIRQDQRHFSPRRTIPHSPENQTVLDPVPRSVSFNFTGKHGYRHSVEAPAPAPVQSPGIGRVNFHPKVNVSNDPFVAPVLAPSDSDSDISFPPEGFSDAVVPAPVGLEPVVQKNSRVSLMELEEVIEMSEKSEPLDGIKKCETEAVGLKEHTSDIDRVGHMQCYAA